MALIPCPSCAREVSYDAETCPSCGHPIARARRAQEKQRQTRLGAIGCLSIVGIFVAIGVVGALIDHFKGSEDSPPEPASVATPAAPIIPPTEAQAIIARELFCQVENAFQAERRKQGLGGSIELEDPRFERLTDLNRKYFGPLTGQIASRLGVSQDRAEMAIGLAQAEMGEHKLPSCSP